MPNCQTSVGANLSCMIVRMVRIMDGRDFDGMFSFGDDSIEEDNTGNVVAQFITKIENIQECDTDASFINKTLPLVSQHVQNILGTVENNIKSCNNGTQAINNGDLRNDVQDCLRVVNTLLSFLSKLNKSSPVTILKYNHLSTNIAKIISVIFLHCKNGEMTYLKCSKEIGALISDLFKKCSTLQSMYFSILLDKIKFDVHNDDERLMLIEVLTTIINIGEIADSLDVKAMADVWKAYIKLCEKFPKYVNEEIVYRNSFKTLYIVFKNNISNLSSEVSDSKSLARNVKVITFILKIYAKIIKLVMENLKLYVDDILSFLIFLHENLSSYLTSSNIPSVITHLVDNIIPEEIGSLLSELLPDIYFQNCFTRYTYSLSSDNSNFGFLYLIVNIIKKLIHLPKTVKLIWMTDSEDHIICILLNIVQLCNTDLLKNIKLKIDNETLSIYDCIILNTSCLILSHSDINVTEKILMKSILNVDIWNGLFICDLWTTLSRYLPSEFICDNFEFLVDTYERLKLENLLINTPQYVYMRQLLSIMFKTFHVETKNRMYRKYPLSEHIDLWIILGIHNVSDNYDAIEMERTLNGNIVALKVFSNGAEQSYEKYRIAFDYLSFLSTTSFEDFPTDDLKNQLANIVADFWIRVLSNGVKDSVKDSGEGSRWFSDLVSMAVNITISLRHYFKNKMWIEILHSAKLVYDELPSFIKISLVKMINIFSVGDIKNDSETTSLMNSISELMGKFLNDHDTIIRLFFMQTLLNIAVTTQNKMLLNALPREIINKFANTNKTTEIEVHEEYLKNLHHYEFQHRCENIDAAHSVQDNPNEKQSVTETIKTIQSDFNVLNELLKTESLSMDQKYELENIKYMICNMLN